MRGEADMEAYTVCTINIISQWQYFVARCLITCVDNGFGLHSMCMCPGMGKAYSLVPGTVPL
jgi:hypothetical protein